MSALQILEGIFGFMFIMPIYAISKLFEMLTGSAF